jgi:4-hydroxybutyrate CoA-transferase
MTTASDWRDAVRDRLVSADEAARRVKDGDLVRLPLGPVPISVVEALGRRRDTLRGVRVWQGATGYPHPWTTGDPAWVEHVQYLTDYASIVVRPAMQARQADFVVTDFALGSRVQRDGRRDNWAADVFMALVSEPDEHGRVSFGHSLWHSKGLLRAARLRIAEVASGLLRPAGDTLVELSAFDLIVEQTAPQPRPRSPYPELSPERIDVTEVIGAYVSTLVNDRDTIQIGTGTLSSCMGSYLTEKRDLGIDSEILVASAIELVKCGAATGRYKTSHVGAATGSYIVPGSDFAFCEQNPAVQLFDIEYVNNLPRIAAVPNLVAINQASAIDLTGQAASESIGEAMYSGPGGQLMWTMGALFAPGGRAIHVLPATARGGNVSRIVARHAPGTVITVPRTFVDFVVTEHGIANLQGLSQRERALALIDLAAPQFRESLRGEARHLFWP